MKLALTAVVAVLVTYSALAVEEEAGRAGDERYLLAFTEYQWDGPYEDFYDYTPDLSVALIDDSIRSICARGFWIFYDLTNYMSGNSTAACYLHTVDNCFNMSTPCSDVASSLRYAGSPFGLDDNYYNLYEGESFQGAELRGNVDQTDLGDLDGKVSSLIVFGQSGWTFYTGPNFTGTAVCVPASYSSTNDDIVMQWAYYREMSLLDLPDDSIRSVKRGCLTDNIVSVPAADDGDGELEEQEAYVPLY